jgi:hypothetical protein
LRTSQPAEGLPIAHVVNPQTTPPSAMIGKVLEQMSN